MPGSPLQDLEVGALVTVEGYEGVGLIKFNGNAKHGKAEGKVRIGIQLKDKPDESKQHTNGTFGSVEYFKCKAGYGLLVAPSKVTVSKKTKSAAAAGAGASNSNSNRPASPTKSTTSVSSSRPTSPTSMKAKARAKGGGGGGSGGGSGAAMVVTLDRSGEKTVGCKFMANPLGKGGVAIKAVDAAGQAAGKLVPGDVITHINGKNVSTMAMPAIGALMKKAGADVRFTLERRAERSADADANGGDGESADNNSAATAAATAAKQSGTANNHPSYPTAAAAAAAAAAHPGAMVNKGVRPRVSVDVDMSEGKVLTPTSYDVVIISDAPDRNMAEKIKESLTKAGLSVWLDPQNREEKTFMRQSGWLIPLAKCILPLLSPNFASSRLCLQELALAQLLDKRTVPVSLVPFEQLRIDFHTVLILSQVEIEFLTSFAMYEATLETVEAVVRSAMVATETDTEVSTLTASSTTATSHTAAQVDTRKAWNLPAVPPHQRLPFWTTAFGHVEQVEWDIFISALFMHLPILNSVPKSINQSQTQISNLIARMLPPFGPNPPEHVNRSDMVAAGFPVDKFCGPFAQHLLLIYGTTISAELAFGPSSEVRSLAIDAIVATGNKRHAATVTRTLVNLAAAWDPAVILGAITPLSKLHSARFRGSSGTPIAPEVVTTAKGLLDHPNFSVKTAAARAAGDIQIHEMKGILEELYRNDLDVTLRDTAWRSLEILKMEIPLAKAGADGATAAATAATVDTNEHFNVVFRAQNVDAKDSNGFSDPYLTLSVAGTQMHKTEVIKKTRSPTWASFEISIADFDGGNMDCEITATVVDWDRMSGDDVIGEAKLTLKDLCGGGAAKWPILNAKKMAGGSKAKDGYQSSGDLELVSSAGFAAL